MNCPRCEQLLEIRDLDGENVEACEECGGIWLHKHQLNKLLKESNDDLESCSIDDRPHRDRFPPIKCEQCGDITMKKINFLDYSRIIMDYCPGCGSFWLDRGELDKMHSYIKQIEDGTHHVKNRSAFDLLVKLSRMAYSIFK